MHSTATITSRSKSLRIILLPFLILFGAISSNKAFAQLQELEIETIENPAQTIPVFRDYPDDAAIIIYSSLTGLQFDSNVEIVADLSDPNSGEYRLVIPPFRQSITATMPGFRQLRFSVPVNSPRQVLFYEIRPLEQEANLISNFFSISPLTAADGANVFIDGQGIDIKTAVKLTPGPHQLRIEKSGYKTIIEEIDVSEQNVIYNYEMELLQVEPVTIQTLPNQASIEVNNVLKSNNDYQDFLYPGDYYIRISKAGYKTVGETITVVENRTQDPNVNVFTFNLEKYAGTLNLNVSPANARVMLNRQPYNANAPISVAPGQYLMEITANGYRPYSETINILEDAVENRTINLEQIVGTLQFRIQPISASVTLYNFNNQVVRQWNGIQLIPNLPIGQYRISATAQDYQDYSEAILIQENQTYEANISMTPISVIEQQQREREQQLAAERRRQDAEQEQRRQAEAAKERRRNVFRYPAFGGMYLNYTTFSPEAAAFSDNVEEQLGLGLGFFRYNKNFNWYMDFNYHAYTLSENVVAETDILDEITSYNFSAGLVPTLTIGPFLVGYGLGTQINQYQAVYSGVTDDAFYYTTDVYSNLQLSFKPKSWGLGFLFDTRKNFDIGLYENYSQWSQVKFSLIWAYNR